MIRPDKEKLEVDWHPTHLSQAEHSWSEELLTSVQAEHSQPLELARAHILKIIENMKMFKSLRYTTSIEP